jgi:predicted RNA-binding Zn ribbon-like protein
LMETPEYIERLRIVGGNPALDFVNTEDGDPPSECLRNYGDLVSWGVRTGLLSANEGERLAGEAGFRPEEAETVYHDALGLRGALYGIFRTVAEGGDVPERALETVRGYEREALSRGRLVRQDEHFAWRWDEERDLARMLWPVVHAATGLLTAGDLERLKLCAGCYWVFLDASRNRSRRWCTMEVCGTDEKMRRYVAKRRRGRKGSGE